MSQASTKSDCFSLHLFSRTQKLMAKQEKTYTKNPVAGRLYGETIPVRLTREMITAIDKCVSSKDIALRGNSSADRTGAVKVAGVRSLPIRELSEVISLGSARPRSACRAEADEFGSSAFVDPRPLAIWQTIVQMSVVTDSVSSIVRRRLNYGATAVAFPSSDRLRGPSRSTLSSAVPRSAVLSVGLSNHGMICFARSRSNRARSVSQVRRYPRKPSSRLRLISVTHS
jgi:hypothetical protein